MFMARTSRPTDDSLAILVSEIHNKLDGVVFNGGFEALVQNVQNIEKTQREMLEKMEDVHQVIYEPDDGLFARVKKVETIHREELEPLKRDITRLVEWKQELQSKDGTLAQVSNDHVEMKTLLDWKKRIIALALGATGSVFLLMVKAFYELIRDHISLH